MTTPKSPPPRPSLESQRGQAILGSAVAEARRVIHDNAVERLKALLVQYPALLSWQGADEDGKDGLLGIAARSSGNGITTRCNSSSTGAST